MLTLTHIPIPPPKLPPTSLSSHLCHSTGRIWLDNLNCRGTEQSVTECASRGWGNSDCTHDEDAGVICKDERLPGFSDSNVIEVCRSDAHTTQDGRQRGLWGGYMWLEEKREDRGSHMPNGIIWVDGRLGRCVCKK